MFLHHHPHAQVRNVELDVVILPDLEMLQDVASKNSERKKEEERAEEIAKMNDLCAKSVRYSLLSSVSGCTECKSVNSSSQLRHLQLRSSGETSTAQAPQKEIRKKETCQTSEQPFSVGRFGDLF